MRQRSHHGGFTLIEVMVTVGVIAVLAAIAVPAFTRESRKSKASSEVAAMFGELALRQDQYKLENGAYFNASAACPTTTVATGQAAGTCASSTWGGLRVRLPQENLACSYQVVGGTGTGATAPTGFTFTSPPGVWFYLLATCDGDGQTGTNATFFVSSVSSKIQSQNEGH